MKPAGLPAVLPRSYRLSSGNVEVKKRGVCDLSATPVCRRRRQSHQRVSVVLAKHRTQLM